MATKEDEKHYPTRTESSLLFIHHISEQGVFDSAAGARHSPQGLIHLDISLQEIPVKQPKNESKEPKICLISKVYIKAILGWVKI